MVKNCDGGPQAEGSSFSPYPKPTLKAWFSLATQAQAQA